MNIDWTNFEHGDNITPFDLIREFHRLTNPNLSSTTLWHGIDDILNRKIPDFFLANLVESDLVFLKKSGYKN